MRDVVQYDDEDLEEAALRELTLVALAYLRGEGTITQERGWLRSRQVLTIRSDTQAWRLWRGALGSDRWTCGDL